MFFGKGKSKMQCGPPICWACIHFHDRESRSCEAFPKGIPNKIYFEAYDHRRPFPGDEGVGFEKVPEDAVPPAVSYFFEEG